MRSRQSSAILHQPHPRPAAPIDQPDASLLQRPPEGCEDGAPRLRNAALKLSNRHRANLGCLRQIILGPKDERSGGAALGWCHAVILRWYRFSSIMAIYNFQ